MILPRVIAGSKAPPMHWWGNAFYRVWNGWEQLVIVIRLPWWRYAVHASDIVPPREEGMPYYAQTWMAHEQLTISWRRREGWRKGWRAVE